METIKFLFTIIIYIGISVALVTFAGPIGTIAVTLFWVWIFYSATSGGSSSGPFDNDAGP